MRNISVYSVKKLDKATCERIEKSFSSKHREESVFEYFVDPSLIGGILVIDGNDYYDSTIAGRLAKVRRGLQ